MMKKQIISIFLFCAFVSSCAAILNQDSNWEKQKVDKTEVQSFSDFLIKNQTLFREKWRPFLYKYNYRFYPQYSSQDHIRWRETSILPGDTPETEDITGDPTIDNAYINGSGLTREQFGFSYCDGEKMVNYAITGRCCHCAEDINGIEIGWSCQYTSAQVGEGASTRECKKKMLIVKEIKVNEDDYILNNARRVYISATIQNPGTIDIKTQSLAQMYISSENLDEEYFGEINIAPLSSKSQLTISSTEFTDADIYLPNGKNTIKFIVYSSDNEAHHEQSYVTEIDVPQAELMVEDLLIQKTETYNTDNKEEVKIYGKIYNTGEKASGEFSTELFINNIAIENSRENFSSLGQKTDLYTTERSVFLSAGAYNAQIKLCLNPKAENPECNLSDIFTFTVNENNS